MAKLDKSKDFGTIVNDDEGRCYEQGGKYFDVDGFEFGVKRAEPAKAEAKTGKAPAAVEDQLKAQ